MESVFAGSSQKKLGEKSATLQPYVLTDSSLVITKKSINRFFGNTAQSDWLNEFMQGFSRYGLGATGLLNKLANPILFQTTKKGGFPTIEEAYSIETLIEASNFILFAKKEGFLSIIELKFATIAESIINWHKSSPFHLQIAEITGLNLLKWKAQQQMLATISKKQKEPAHIWINALPDTFWNFLLTELHTDWKRIIRNPLSASKFVHEWIFARLPEATMEEMRNSKPKRIYRSKKGPQKLELSSLDAYLKLLDGMYGISERNLSILDQLLSKTHPLKRTAHFEAETQRKTFTGFALQLQEAVTSTQ